MQKKRYYITFVILLCLVNTIILAQNNPLKINDKLYDYYDKCRRKNKEAVSLKMADTLFVEAEKIHDVKAQCVAYYIRGSYYYFSNDIENLKKELDNTIRFSEKTPYTQYIFGIWSLCFNYYANQAKYVTALEELKKMQKKAIEIKDEYGIGLSYSKYGDIYALMGNNQASINEYQKAVDYYKSVGREQELFDLYTRIGNRYLNLRQFDMAEKYSLESLKLSKVEDGKANIYLLLIDLYINMGNKEKTDFYMNLLNNWEKKYKLSYVQRNEKNKMLFTYNLAFGNYDEAESLLDSNSYTKEAYTHFLYQFYKSKQNYGKALSYFEKYQIITNARKGQMQLDQLAEYSSMMDNDRLKAEKNDLALKNAAMSILQLQSKQKFMILDKEHNRLLLRNANLELNNRDLQLISQQAKISQQHAEMQRQKEKSKRMTEESFAKERNDTLIMIILAITLIAVFAYAVVRTRAARRIRREMMKEAEARREAQEAREEAMKADRLKSLFLQNVSHEIRTPLNAIVGFSSVVSDPEGDYTPDERKEFVDLIQSNSELLTTLVNDILDLSKMESGSYKVNPEPKNLNDICKGILSSISGHQAPGVELKLDIPQESITLLTDGMRLTQLLTNLMTNACKYTERGSITLGYSRQGESVVFTVTDTGSGIAPENAEIIFQRFEKLDSFKQGTGLGLNICKHIAQLLDGEICLDTNYTSGARFVFVHPMK